MALSLFRTLSPHSAARIRREESKPDIKLRSVRPSLLDPRFTGDAWIVDQGDGLLALQLGDYRLTEFLGLPLDVPSLNERLHQVWNRRPRSRRISD